MHPPAKVLSIEGFSEKRKTSRFSLKRTSKGLHGRLKAHIAFLSHPILACHILCRSLADDGHKGKPKRMRNATLSGQANELTSSCKAKTSARPQPGCCTRTLARWSEVRVSLLASQCLPCECTTTATISGKWTKWPTGHSGRVNGPGPSTSGRK